MNQTIFDIDQPLPKKQMVTYDLVPSQHLVNIRSVLASRKRKSSSSSASPSALSPVTDSTLKKTRDQNNKKQKQLVFDDMISGLPSPPVESPMAEFPNILTPSNMDQSPPPTPNLSFTSSSNSSSTTSQDNTSDNSCTGKGEEKLTTEEIKEKLAKLREEKHNLFQLMKRLVEQEEKQKQQQQQKQQVKKKKQSRWSTYQQPTPLPSPSLLYTPRTVNSTKPVRTQDGYFGSSQRLQ